MPIQSPPVNLTEEEKKIWFAQHPPTNQDVTAAADRIRNDPLGAWWNTLTGNQGSVEGRMASASGAGVNPIRTGNEALGSAQAAQLARGIQGSDQLNAVIRQNENAPNHTNPYNQQFADQSRGAQLALMEQMRLRQAGPSVAAMQGQQNLSQGGQQALMQGGRAGLLGAQHYGAGASGDVAQARLAEAMRAQAGISSAAGNLRGADLQSFGRLSQTGIQQGAMDDQRRQFYAQQGFNLNQANLDAAAQRRIAAQQQTMRADQRDLESAKQQAASSAQLIAAGAGMK